MGKPSGRPGTGNRRYRRNRQTVLDESEICGICHHYGAKSTDHIIAQKLWIKLHGSLKGYDDVENLQPAHGTMGNRALNPCPVCRRLCNQSRGAKPLTMPHSRRW